MNRLETQLRNWALAVSKEKVTPTMLEKLGDSGPLAIGVEKTVNVFTFTYDSDGDRISGFLTAPKKINEKLPVIIFNRGGTADFGMLRKGQLFSWMGRMSEWGYIVIGTQYPGNSTSEGSDERGGPSDVGSILKLHDLIDSLDDADKDRIGMYGFSRGGMMTYLCMKQVIWIKAALTLGGLTNLDRTLRYRPEMAELYDRHFKNTQASRDVRSVVKWADKLSSTTPLCLLHGTDDWRVDVHDALELGEKLAAYQHPFSLHILQGGDHMLSNMQEERDEIIRNWFDKYLKDTK